MIEITRITVHDPAPTALEAVRIDAPRPGDRLDGHVVRVNGWLIGRGRTAVAVELVSGDAVIGRSSVDESARFGVEAPVTGMTPLSFEVRAVLADQTRADLATVHVQRQWDADLGAIGAPLVSVIIPCFDHSRFLGEAIESVLSQTYPHFEVIVVDDGSHDNASAVARRYPGVTYARQSNDGPGAARNTGFGLSRGSYVVFLDADDRLRSEALSTGLLELASDPTAAFTSGQCLLIGFDGRPLLTESARVVETDHYRELLRNCYIWTNAAVMYRRIALVAVGGFDTSFSGSTDHDLYLRIARAHRVRCHGHVVAEYRRHGTNMTRDPGANLRDRIRVLRKQRKTCEGTFGPYLEAYRAGLAFGRAYYGEALLGAVLSDVATGQWRRALKGYRTLLVHYPRGAAAALLWFRRLKSTAA